MRFVSRGPQSWEGSPGSKKARILFVCHYDPSSIHTVVENVEVWRSLSRYDLVIHNTWPSKDRTLMLSADVDLCDFVGVLIHSAVCYSFENLVTLGSRLKRGFRDYDGVKILMKQDEQVKSAKVARRLRDKRFDLLLTYVPAQELHKVYPKGRRWRARLHAHLHPLCFRSPGRIVGQAP